MRLFVSLVVVVILGLLVSACGGSSADGGSESGTQPPNSFSVSTSTTGTGSGTISPASNSITQGSTTTFTLSAGSDSSITSVSGCGGSLSGSTYTISPINGDCTVTATFNLREYTVSASAGTGGSISPNSQTVPHGGVGTFTVVPSTGYAAHSGSGCAGSLEGDVYTTGPIRAGCEITVDFVQTGPSGALPPVTTGVRVEGRALIPEDQYFTSLRSVPEKQKGLFEMLSSPFIKEAHAADPGLADATQSIFDVLCYASYPTDGFAPNVDLNGDQVADINLTDSSGRIYKNIASDSYGLLPESAQNWNVVADLFLLDIFSELLPNVVTASGVNLNIPSHEGVVLFNVDNDNDGVPELNIVNFDAGQPNGVAILNFDGNYDGIPDLNIDRDNDGIADTKIDENGDCVPDYSITDVDGAIGAADAQVELLDVGSWEVLYSTRADQNGAFEIESVKTGYYYLKIVANNGVKDVGTIVGIVIAKDGAIGEYRLSSAPILLEVRTPTSSINGLLNSEFRYSDSLDFTQEAGLGFYFKFYEFNQRPVAYARFVCTGPGDCHYEYFNSSLTQDPHVFELIIGFDLLDSEALCRSSLTGSTSSADWYVDDANMGYCRLDHSLPDYQYRRPSNVSEISTFGDMFCVVNRDGFSSFSFTGGNNGSECDLFIYLELKNSGLVLPEAATLDITNITVNDVDFPRTGVDGSLVISADYRPVVMPSVLNIDIDLDTTLSLEMITHGVTLETSGRCAYESSRLATEGPLEIALECAYERLQYRYTLSMSSSCQASDCGIYIGDGAVIRYHPPINEKPATVTGLLLDGVSFHGRVIRAGETVSFAPTISDPNGLPNEWQICFLPNGPAECSAWMQEGESYARAFTANDATSQFRVDIRLRNNDGVAVYWSKPLGSEEYTEEYDLFQRFFLSVSE